MNSHSLWLFITNLFFLISIIIILIVVNASDLNAEDIETNFVLKAGLGPSFTFLKSERNGISHHPGLAVGTHVGYRYQNLEMGIGSYAHVTLKDDVTILIDSSPTHTKSGIVSVTFGPKLRYFFPSTSTSMYYITFMPFIGLDTLYLNSQKNIGSGSDGECLEECRGPGYKMNYETKGFVFGGGKEWTRTTITTDPANSADSFFAEIVFKFAEAHKKTFVGGNPMIVKKIWRKDGSSLISQYTIMLLAGIKIF